MECQEESIFSCSRLLYPELFSREEILQILKTYCVAESKLKGLNNEELLNLFNRLALPLPQRQYDESRRGKYLMELRAKQQASAQESSLSSQKTETKVLVTNNGVHTSKVKSNSPNTSTRVERLKPPIDLINYERKKINLTKVTKSSNQSKSDNKNDLEKIIIKSRKKESKTEEKITQSCKINSKDFPVSNKIVLKRPILPPDNPKETDESVSKKAKVLVS